MNRQEELESVINNFSDEKHPKDRMSKKIRLVIIALSLITCSCLVSIPFILRSFSEEEGQIFIDGERYSINADTILEELSEDKTDVFTPQNELPTERSRKYVQWKPDDYYLIAQTLHELMWDETLEAWDMSLISFGWDCENFDKGPQEAHFRYFKAEKLRGRKTRFVSDLTILPQKNSVSGFKEEHYSRTVRWDAINLSRLEISVEEALDIAEKNGGAEIRAAVGNSCQISAILNPASPAYDGWIVRYSSSSLVTLNLYYIDPNTGEVEDKK